MQKNPVQDLKSDEDYSIGLKKIKEAIHVVIPVLNHLTWEVFDATVEVVI